MSDDMVHTISGPGWELEYHQPVEYVTYGVPTGNERWRALDSNGHEHHWGHGYPTLNHVVDVEHWCDGDEGIAPHDPHMAVDESHYECKACGERVEPKMDPPNMAKPVLGQPWGELSGPTAAGAWVKLRLTDAELSSIIGAPGQAGEAARAILGDPPMDRVSVMQVGGW